MWNRRAMLTRIIKAKEAGVPITNYGLTIAYSLGIFERALELLIKTEKAKTQILQETKKALLSDWKTSLTEKDDEKS